MKWSLKLGSFAGIRVYLHWTFILLLGWILLSHLGQGHGWTEAWRGIGFIIAIFVYLGAEAEAQAVETTSFIGGLQVNDALMQIINNLTMLSFSRTCFCQFTMAG